MIGRISHVMMWARDLDQVSRWYKDTFGFQVTYHAPGEFLSLSSESMGRLDFHAMDPADLSDNGKGAMPYFTVADIAAVKSWLESKGVKVGEIQQEGDSPKHAWFRDCAGNEIGIEEV